MAKAQHVEVTPKQIKRAEETWASFATMGKWATIATCAVLVILAVVFIDW